MMLSNLISAFFTSFNMKKVIVGWLGILGLLVLFTSWGFSLIEKKQYQNYLSQIRKNAQIFQISFSRLIESKYLLEEIFFQEIETAKSAVIEDYHQNQSSIGHLPKLLWVIDTLGQPQYMSPRIPSDKQSEVIQTFIHSIDPDHFHESFFPGYFQTDSALYFMQAEYQQGRYYGLGISVAAPEMMNYITHLNRFIEAYFQFSNFQYVCWQDEDGIIAGSPAFLTFPRIANDSFLQDIQSIQSRHIRYQDKMIVEIVLPLIISHDYQGILRIGFSLQEYQKTVINFRWRSILVLLVLISMVLAGYGYTWHRNKILILNREYYNLTNYTGLILQSVDDSVIVLDANSKLVYSNSSFLQLLGLSNPDRLIYLGGIDEVFPLTQIIQNRFGELEFTNHNLIKKTIYFQLKNFIDSKGGAQKIILIRDISRYKELEHQSRQTERMSLLGKMSSMVAHEIRNPLNTVHMIIQRLGMEFTVKEKSDDYHHFIALVMQEVSRINQIVTKFLEYGRLPSPIKEWVNIRDVLAGINELIQIWMQEKPFQWEMNTRSQFIWLDRNQILQVLINLLKNSYQALPETGGKIELQVKIIQAELEMTIRDNGSGISRLSLDKVFEMYFTTKEDGSGFGLPISKRIIEDHGGRIELESQEYQGTIVRILLPLEPEPPDGSVPPVE